MQTKYGTTQLTAAEQLKLYIIPRDFRVYTFLIAHTVAVGPYAFCYYTAPQGWFFKIIRLRASFVAPR